jgi:colicin import membrane protein
MHVASDRLEFAPPPTRGLLRALGLAVLVHAFLLAALTWGVQWNSQALTESAEVELWSALPQSAAARLVQPPPELELQPAPLPPSAEPVPNNADIVLAREKQLKLEQEQQRKAELMQKKLQEKKAAEEKRKAEQATRRKEALKEQEDAKKLLEAREAQLKRMAGLAGATGAPGASGTGLQSSGPSSSYAGRIRGRIKPNIVFVDAIDGNPMAEVEVRAALDGTIISRKLLKSSGVKSWDDAVLKAIDKTEKFPLDVDGRVPSPLIISFKPKD